MTPLAAASAFGQPTQPFGPRTAPLPSLPPPALAAAPPSESKSPPIGVAVPTLPEGEIAPSALNRTEVQMVQDALIWNSVYAGLKDGGWGRMSADGVREWRRARGLRASETFTAAELATLFESAIRARNAVGWGHHVDPNTGAWVGLPMGLLKRPARQPGPTPNGVTTVYEGIDDRLRVEVMNLNDGVDSARRFITGARATMIENGGVERYRLDRPDRQVVSYDVRGLTLYMRFDRVGTEWRGFVILTKQNIPQLRNVITAVSAEFNPLGSPTISGDGPTISPILASLAARGVVAGGTPPLAATTPAPPLAPPPAAVQTQPAAAATPPPSPAARREISGSGTGFVVRRDGIIMTNHHVIRGCSSVALQSGERVTVVATDETADLAILRVQGRTFERIARFRRDQTIDLGEAVTAFGYPHFQSISTALNITNGIVSALVGVADNPANFQINAALQPGNSGGPVLDSAGLVIGVAVARLSDRRIMAATGTVPQTMNYAVRGQIAEAFLLRNGVLVEKVRSEGTMDLKEVARNMQQAVLPVLCYQ